MHEKFFVRTIAASVLVGISGMPTAVLGQYTFVDWAWDHGYSPGDVMPGEVDASSSSSSSPDINSLFGMGIFDWNTTPTTKLDVSYNQISRIESDAFCKLSNLTELYIYRNRITSLESHAFNGLTNLAELTLFYNQISSIESGGFFGLTNLTKLILDTNKIANIEPGAFSGLTNLRTLSLFNNALI